MTMWAGKALEDVPGNGVALPLLSFCSAYGAASRRRARIRDTRDGDKVHRSSRICSTLSCLLVDNEGEPLGDPFVLRDPEDR